MADPWALDLDAMTPHARTYWVGYVELVARLRAEGFRVTYASAPHPVQLMGYLPSGEGFFFYGKYTHCSLGIAATDEAAVDVRETGDNE